MSSILVTGANRGIGLEFVRQYAADGDRIFACCRDPERAEALNAIGASHPNVSIHVLDVSRHGQIETLAKHLQDETIDVLINNAGVYPDRGVSFDSVDYDEWIDTFRINTMAPLKVAECFLESVRRSERKIIATLSSKVGSLADNSSGGRYVYRSSKTAVNMVMKSLSIDLEPEGITAMILHPGWVQTDMGGPNALITVEQSVEGMRGVIKNASMKDTGQFFNYDGSTIPW